MTQTQLVSSLMTTHVVLETLVYSPCNHLTWLLAQENFVEFSHHESLKLYQTPLLPYVMTLQLLNHFNSDLFFLN